MSTLTTLDSDFDIGLTLSHLITKGKWMHPHPLCASHAYIARPKLPFTTESDSGYVYYIVGATTLGKKPEMTPGHSRRNVVLLP